MKKFLIFLAMTVSMISAYGQMTPIKKVGAVKTIATARSKYVKLNRLEKEYYLCITATGNRFDDPAIFDLGISKAQAGKTLVELIDLCHTLADGESVYVMNRSKKVCITNNPMLGISVLYFTIPGIAGRTTCITHKELLKFQKALDKYVE